MKEKWSKHLTDKFMISLTPELISWFDDGLFESSMDVSLGIPIHPENLVNSDSGYIWGGQMLPDTLPIIDDGCGNIIGIRVDSKGCLKELIYWDHETGEWSPEGNCLSQVVAMKAVKIFVEYPSESIEVFVEDTAVQWALKWLNINIEKIHTFSEMLRNKSQMELSLGVNLPKIPLLNFITRESLLTTLEKMCYERGGLSIAKSIGIQYDQLNEWTNNPILIPEKYRDKLTKLFHCTIEELLFQDWESALKYSQIALSIREDLSWPYHVIAEYWERHGNIDKAVPYYLKGLNCLNGTASFTSLWSYLGAPSKYSAKKLLMCRNILPDEVLRDSYFQAVSSKDSDKLYEYWQSHALEMESKSDYANAYNSWYSAGWDDYRFDYMQTVVEGLVRTSELAGFNALHKIALRHKESM